MWNIDYSIMLFWLNSICQSSSSKLFFILDIICIGSYKFSDILFSWIFFSEFTWHSSADVFLLAIKPCSCITIYALLKYLHTRASASYKRHNFFSITKYLYVDIPWSLHIKLHVSFRVSLFPFFFLSKLVGIKIFSARKIANRLVYIVVRVWIKA